MMNESASFLTLRRGLDSVINHFKAVKKADNRYKSFGGIKKNAKGSVKFVIETDPIEADEN